MEASTVTLIGFGASGATSLGGVLLVHFLGKKRAADVKAVVGDVKQVVTEIKVSVDGRLDAALTEIKLQKEDSAKQHDEISQLKRVIAELLPAATKNKILNGTK